jgi:hypothetical protein
MAALALWDYAQASIKVIFGRQFMEPLAEKLLYLLESHPEGCSNARLISMHKQQTNGRFGEVWTIATNETEATDATNMQSGLEESSSSSISSDSFVASVAPDSYANLARLWVAEREKNKGKTV